MNSDEKETKLPIGNYTRRELEQLLAENFNQKPFRARQVFKWLYQNLREQGKVTDFSDMTDISLEFRKTLSEAFSLPSLEIVNFQESIDGTIKFVFKLNDGQVIESVLIAQEKRYTLCVSSQVGCAIGCKFCRTALMGLKRNLEPWEIIAQARSVLEFVAQPPEEVKSTPKAFSNVVFMGMGEPLHNSKAVFKAARVLNDDLGFAISKRRITVSTSGMVGKIIEMADQEVPVSLALSLNASHDEQRSELIPLNKKWPLAELKRAVKHWNNVTGGHATVEYVMLGGVNDTEEDLNRLPKFLSGIGCKVNLIPYNDNAGLGYKAPSRKNIDHWRKSLEKKGFNTRVRWSKGPDIDAACGQLAVNTKKQ